MSEKSINYLNKDFDNYKKSLLDFIKTYFSDQIGQIDENDPMMIFVDLASYVGDVLSYYTDQNLKESMLYTASEKTNVYRIAQAMGYRPRIVVPSKTSISVFQQIPAIGSGDSNEPDMTYALSIKPTLTVSAGGQSFIADNSVDFAYSSSDDPTTISIYDIDEDTSEPTYYLLEKQVPVTNGEIKTTSFSIDSPEKYKKLLLRDSNIVGIEKIIDSDGNIWHEVPYLAQDTIFTSEKNTNSSGAAYTMKQTRVTKRFISRYLNDNELEIQFGAGILSNQDETFVPNPKNIGKMVPTGIHNLNEDYSLANFMYTDSYGEVPRNTELTVYYRTSTGYASNVPAGTIDNITNIEFNDSEVADNNMLSFVKQSIAVTNKTPAQGGRSSESIEEIKQNSLSFSAAQNRIVTIDDYVSRALSMNPKYGSIAKAYVIQDKQLNLFDYKYEIENPLSLNLYVLSYDHNKHLTSTNQEIKKNLVTYLDHYRMVTDSINIRDAHVININIRYTITTLSNYNSKEVLLETLKQVRKYFEIDNWQINEPILISKVIKTIANVEGVQSVIDIDFTNLFDTNSGYHNNIYDVANATRNNIIYPPKDPSIFEVKYPNKDIQGKTISY